MEREVLCIVFALLCAALYWTGLDWIALCSVVLP